VLELSQVAETAERLQPAHMPYLFPEVFLRDKPGFDVILGNPPWEKLKVETDGWWGLRLPGLRSMPQREKIGALKAFRESRPDLEHEFEVEQEQVLALNAVIKSGPFDLGSGDTDLYQAFAWRNWQLLQDGGRSAVVLPRTALSGSALAGWRRSILAGGGFPSVCFIENAARWAFDMEPRYTIGLTVIAKGAERAVRFAGPFNNEKDFVAGDADLAEVPGEEFASWSSSAAFPLIPDPVSAQVFRQLKKSPRFDETSEGWEFRPLRELDATNDKRVLEFDTDEARDRVPVFTGASFNVWDPDAGTPYAYAKPGTLRPYLANKLSGSLRHSRSAYHDLSFQTGILPMDSARIAFRDIARSNDTRTAIACLIPPGASAVHKAPLLVRRAGDAQAEACLLGIMSSIPFDWHARRWVELTMSFELLNSFPVPRPDGGSNIGARIVQIAGRLAAVDDRYSSWASQVGVPVGSVKANAEKDDLIAELDALVCLLYGLTEDQVEHVFATFHRGWDYEPRLEAVLRHYRVWKDKA
jgi:hypothetical protein